MSTRNGGQGTTGDNHAMSERDFSIDDLRLSPEQIQAFHRKDEPLPAKAGQFTNDQALRRFCLMRAIETLPGETEPREIVRAASVYEAYLMDSAPA